MTTKHFDAILAKNEIARELRDGDNTGELGMVAINTSRVLSALRDIEDFIEDFIGEANQPSIDDIINCDKYDL